MHTAAIFDTTAREAFTISLNIPAGTMYATLAKAEHTDKSLPGIFKSTVDGFAKACVKGWATITGEDASFMEVVDARVVWSNGPAGLFIVCIQDKYRPDGLISITVTIGRDH